jgi:hypothetical protein
MIAPDVTIDDNNGTILISSEEGETEGNNDKSLNVSCSSLRLPIIQFSREHRL